MVFERFQEEGERLVRDTRKQFSLAGWNNGLLYKAWEKNGGPLDKGWHVSADELIQIYSGGSQSKSTRMLGIDWNPGWKNGIGLIELLDVYAYTYGNGSGEASWTPIMLRMRDVLYIEDMDISKKDEILSRVQEPSQKKSDFVEFLYITGNDKYWNWGMNGMTNAAFLEKPAREYFRPFF